jgi:dipeptidyl aminopeptidase/acylaminoacyl peptidase
VSTHDPGGPAASSIRTPLPYGGWPSPLSAHAIARGAGALGELRVAGNTLYWLEGRPEEDGRTTLLCAHVADADRGASGSGDPTALNPKTSEPRELTPRPYNVRGRIHEYGGGAYLPTQAGVFFVNAGDGELYHLPPDGAPRRLTDCGGNFRFGDFSWDVRRSRLLAVCERPAPGSDSTEPENLLVAIPVRSRSDRASAPVAADALEIVHRGHDFYAAPRLDPDGNRLAFVAWDHPNMPWDGTLLNLAELDADGRIVAETIVAGGAAEAVQQPVWMPDGALLFLSDQTGFWNVHRYGADGVVCLLEEGAEYGEPPWGLGMSSLAALGRDHAAAVRFADGTSEIVLLDTRSGFASPLPSGWQEHESLVALDGAVAFVGRGAERPPAIVVLALAEGVARVIAQAWLPPLDVHTLVAAQPRTFRARDGAFVHGYLYLPQARDGAPPSRGRPPLLVSVHGGPTARASAALNLRNQFFTSRGWAVLEVDYRGSAGYGRRYRDALNGRWGRLDVTDCEDAVRALVDEGLVDPERLAIRGSSAGGFTVLAALAASGLFGAGASIYGIGDLAALARETHKFESRYLDALVGDPSEYATRSPLNHAARIRSAVLFLQGADDRVVPPGQATAMAEVLRRRGVPVAHIEFPGEGHGFRKAAHIEQALASEYAFYCRVFGIAPAEPLAPLEIENL